MSPDPARRNPQATAAILDAALEMAAESGLAKVTIEGIAARAGVGKRTIYRWWPSRGAVVLDAWARRMEGRLFSRLETASGLDFETEITELVKAAWLDVLGDSHTVLAWLVGEAQHDPGLAADLRERLIEPATERVAERIRRAQQAGEVDPDVDPIRAIELVYAQLYYRLLVSGRPTDAAFLEDVTALAMRGLRPR